MKLSAYQTLISNLPVRQQCVETKRTYWRDFEKEFGWLAELNGCLFQEETLKISRQEIFDQNDVARAFVIKVIYWGYAKPGRYAKNFQGIFQSIDSLVKTLRDIRHIDSPTANHFEEFARALRNVKGLGISTYSKLLYFLGIEIDRNPCLILDQTLIKVFSNNVFDEYGSFEKNKYDNAEKWYLDYLDTTNRLAKELQTRGENIEQFLFIFGNHLK
jgi:hypothetical protein